MESEMLELRVLIAQLQNAVSELTERIESLESKESGSGIYIDGVAEGYKEYIKKELGGK